MERGEGSRRPRPTASARRRYDGERERARAERLAHLVTSDPTVAALFAQAAHPAPAPDDDNGGPYDTSLLPHFNHHIARRIWDDRNEVQRILTLKFHASNLHNFWSKATLPISVSLWIDQPGFSHLADHAYTHIDAALVSAFVERWQLEIDTFHMPFGEMTITLDDVKQILGVPLMGRPVHIPSTTVWPDGVDPWLAVMQSGIDIPTVQVPLLKANSENVDLTSLRQLFLGGGHSVEELASEEFRTKLFRGWMLYMLGTVAFPNKSGSKVPVWYMHFLTNPGKVKDYAWGVAILAFLYRELGNASRAKTQQMAGCLPLLLCWIFEHFPNLKRPSFDLAYMEENPRLVGWTVSRAQGNHQESLLTYRHLIDEMDPNHLIWDPYSEQRMTTRPIPEESWYSGLLVCLDTMEPYYPERVVRQFGRIQNIPQNPFVHPTYDSRTGSGKYEVTFNFIVNQLDRWHAHLLDLPARSAESSYMAQCHEGYLVWFYRHSHP